MLIEYKNIKNYDNKQYQQMFNSLDSKQQMIILQHTKKDDRKRSILGYSIAKTSISKYTGISKCEISLMRDENGKPISNVDCGFNVGHSKNMVICAVDSSQVGVDIELIRPYNLRVIQKICNNNDLLYIFGSGQPVLKQCDNEQLLRKFFSVWTAKEAVAKLDGRGIAQNMKKILIDYSGECFTSNNIKIRQHLIEDNSYIYAVAKGV